MTDKEIKQVQDVISKFYDKSLEIVELLKPLNEKQLKFLQISYDIVCKQKELENLKKEVN